MGRECAQISSHRRFERSAQVRQVSVSAAFKHKYPEWIDLVVSRSADGQANAMPVGWSMITSGSPPLYAVAIGRGRYSAGLIHETREFVIAVPSASMGPATLYCGTHSGRDGDKIGPSELELAPATVVSVPLIRGAVYNLECTLHSEFETGDHLLFVGEVVAAHWDEGAGKRLMNFGSNVWACAQTLPETVFRL
jgi:flavin reductase (DIM6/NTAB) family NADH-FMN oxidoreductase RutF